MAVDISYYRKPATWSVVLAILACLLLPDLRSAEPFQITEVRLTQNNQVELSYSSTNDSYYILLRGAQPGSILLPVNLKIALSTADFLVDRSPLINAAFYRIQKVPLNAPLDLDQDGVDDLTELGRGTDPLSGGGAVLTTFSSSPENGEVGVSVTRETIVRFSRPLASNALLNQDNFFAVALGRKILSRIQLSSDRQTATLFYQENLPGSARVRVALIASALRDAQGDLVDADEDGIPGGYGIVEFDTGSLTPVNNTAVIGKVFASDPQPDPQNPGRFINRPLRGVTVTVDGREETLRATTDAEGNFKLAPVPSGRFFVHVDGRTAEGSIWPAGDYYPVVGKAWEAEPGKQDNLAGGTGEIFLPLIVGETLKPVSPTAETTITFPAEVLAQNPALNGVEITVPPNSLFDNSGVRGGKVGIAPVPPDRLPEKLPEGLNFPLVITVQTDGPQNFELPVPVRFPNLPDPKTGKALAAGEKSALWSFNHDMGAWEIIGPMTVSADGKFVETDAGVGIRQPGWHGTQPGVGANGGPLAGPPCDSSGSGKNCVQNPNFRPDDPENYNGCGPDGYDYLVPDNPNGIPCATFFNACRTHDIGYNTCGKPQQQIDDQFLQDMLAACNCIFDPIDRLQCIALAHAYHQAVTGGGEGAYNDAQDKACICEEPPGCGSAPGGGPAGPGLSAFKTGKGSFSGKATVQATGIPVDFVPQTGPHWFAVFDILTGEVVQRGRAGMTGIAFTQLILQPNRTYDILILQEATLWEGHLSVTTGASGSRLEIPTIIVKPPITWDFDGDQLHDAGELILSTDRNNADSDGDGIGDGDEVKFGLNPLGEGQVVTGLIASADTPGIAVDVSALNNLVAVADSGSGVSIFDVRGINPILAAQVDTAGEARRVSWSGGMIAVADGPGGLAIIDAQKPAEATLLHQLPLGTATAVAAAAGLVYVGFESGQVAAVALSSGTVLHRLSLGQPIRDLQLAGDFLYALTPSSLITLDPRGGALTQVHSLASPTVSTPNSRLSIGGDIAYAIHGKGANAFDLSVPAAPRLLSAANTPQFGWEHIVANGTGLGVSAVGTAFAFDQQRVFGLYNISAANGAPAFITSFQHPGHARAVSIFNGLAYGASHDAGLLVFNYLAYDTEGAAPTIALEADFPLKPTAKAEEGKMARLTANVTDDVQVRNVEFYINEVLVAVDGNFPFEHRFVTPSLEGTTTNFTVRAVARDTGGNLAETELITVALTPDSTAPRVVAQSPGAGRIVGGIETVAAFFDEPINPNTLGPTTIVLFSAGPDGSLGTGDDAAVSGGTITYQDAHQAAFLTFSTPLGPGQYQATVKPGVADIAGNTLAEESSWSFLVAGGQDSDSDGVPDDVESLLGLNPNNPDSNNNGVLDGDEDPDGDGLRTSWELAYGFDPRNRDSNGDLVNDGSEDPDNEALTNLQEQAAGTHPLRADTDGDGWSDEVELSVGSDPFNPGKKPFVGAYSRPPVELVAPASPGISSQQRGTVLASPPVSLVAPAAPPVGQRMLGTVVGRPPIDILAPATPALEGAMVGTVLARPSIELLSPMRIEVGVSGTTLALPPVQVLAPAARLTSGRDGTTLANPPLNIEFEKQ